jgi:hypothetical protein
MPAKPEELAKRRGLKINLNLKNAGIPTRFAQGVSEEAARKEQRKKDAAAGLVPFACKLPSSLIAQLLEKAKEHDGGVNALVAAAIEKQLKK